MSKDSDSRTADSDNVSELRTQLTRAYLSGDGAAVVRLMERLEKTEPDEGTTAEAA